MTESMDSATPVEQTLIDAAVARARKARDRRVEIRIDTLGVALTCRIPADGQEIERLGKAAQRIEKGAVQGTNFNRAVVALLTESIRIEGQEIADASGNPLTFSDPALWKMLGADVHDSKGAVVALLGTDGNISRVSSQLIDEGGYTEADADDPI